MIGITMRTIFFITSPVASSREWVSLASLFLIFFRFTQYTKSMKSNADATPAPVPIVAPAAPQAFRTDSSAPLNLFSMTVDIKIAKTATKHCSTIWDNEVGSMFRYA